MTIIEQVRVSAPAEREQSERERRARTLEAAALEVEVRGWCRFHLFQEGRVCAVGAIGFASGGVGVDYVNAATVWFGTNNPTFEECYAVYDFNDARGRTADEVTHLLRWRAEEIRDGR